MTDEEKKLAAEAAAAEAKLKAAEEEKAKAEAEEAARKAEEDAEEEAITSEEYKARLKNMKANVDRMAKERDDTLKKLAEVEQATRDANIKRLEEEGKQKEADALKIADLQAKLEATQKANTTLSRDNLLNNALAALEFRNERSRDLARRDIVDSLVQDENGVWKHQNGSDIASFVNSYAKDENNAFLFKVKTNSGGGQQTNNQPPPEKKKSLKEMTQAEVLAAAAAGTLGTFNL